MLWPKVLAVPIGGHPRQRTGRGTAVSGRVDCWVKFSTVPPKRPARVVQIQVQILFNLLTQSLIHFAIHCCSLHVLSLQFIEFFFNYHGNQWPWCTVATLWTTLVQKKLNARVTCMYRIGLWAYPVHAGCTITIQQLHNVTQKAFNKHKVT